MSSRDLRILTRLFKLAEKSELNTKLASAICMGNKIMVESVNDNRTKYGKNIYCCGHTEANSIHKLMSLAFRDKSKQSLVLVGLDVEQVK